MPSIGEGDARLSGAESRISVLEAQLNYLTARMEKVEAKVESLSERLVRLDERISHLPTKEQVVKIALGTLALVTAITAFQGKIRPIFGL